MKNMLGKYFQLFIKLVIIVGVLTKVSHAVFHDTSDECEAGWIHNDHNCYKTFPTKDQSWIDAQEECLGQDAILARPINRSASDFLFKIAQMIQDTCGEMKRRFYIGLADIDKDNKWTFPGTSDQPSEYFWRIKPKSSSTDRQCAMMFVATRKFFWADIRQVMIIKNNAIRKELFNYTSLAICEKPSKTSPMNPESKEQKKITQSDLRMIEKSLQPVLHAQTRMPSLIRLGFHDCIGGCDGCLNIENHENRGLEATITALEDVYKSTNIDKLMSRADFWALSTMLAIRQAIYVGMVTNRGKPDNIKADDVHLPPLRFGRKDCPTSPYTDEDQKFPQADFNSTTLIEFFTKNFNLNIGEIVAVMGAHRLGGARIENSGFSGVWVNENPVALDNTYFRLMVDDDPLHNRRGPLAWKQVNVQNLGGGSEPRWQWVYPGAFMLNCDMALYKDLKLKDGGFSSLPYHVSPYAVTRRVTEYFASHNKEFVNAFLDVMANKVLTSGNDGLSVWTGD